MSEQYDTDQPWIAGYETLRDELVERGIVPQPNEDSSPLLDSMQTPQAKEAMNRAYNATPEELGIVAVEAAQQEKNEA